MDTANFLFQLNSGKRKNHSPSSSKKKIAKLISCATNTNTKRTLQRGYRIIGRNKLLHYPKFWTFFFTYENCRKITFLDCTLTYTTSKFPLRRGENVLMLKPNHQINKLIHAIMG